MDKRTDTTTTRLLALHARQLMIAERAIEALAKHVATNALADQFTAMTEAHGDDEAASLLYRLARIARR